jgi:predicted dehydrogenase
MGQTAGGTLTLLTPDTSDVPFGDASPFEAQFRAFSAAVDGDRTAWPYDAERDLRLHRLLLEALRHD